jgi:flavin-dependent dehydrogenase
MNTVQIAGGGVAGLSLGLALRREGLPVCVYEAGVYPRHRLCGEFISGAGPEEFGRLGISDVLDGSEVLTEAVWYRGDRLMLRRTLPVPARGISRWRLDASLAKRFTDTGGQLLCENRVAPSPSEKGWVMATGRPRAGHSPWLAQKAHYQNVPMEAGLEMHLGNGGYTGVAAVENGTANVCALFPAALGRQSPNATLTDRLKANGLTRLAARLEAGQPVEGSRCGVSGFTTGWQDQPQDRIALGDHCAIIAPFTGHGMSMAMLAALEIAPHLAAWSEGRLDWEDAVKAIRLSLRKKFHRRLRWASWLHPLLLRPGGQTALSFFARCGLLPWQWLFRRLR